ncbi:MAG: Ig-like domain-containing protein [Christensenellales bacterium]|jgi:hypothetical protein
MNKRFLYAISALLCLILIMYGCNKKENEKNPVGVTGIELSSESEVLIIEDNLRLTAGIMPENATNKNISWASSYEDIATVNEEGEIRALKAGVTTISATTEDGEFTANAVIYVGDAVVSKDYDETSDGYNTTRFNSVAAAINAMDENSTIVVKGGDYNEALSIDKSVILIGTDKPVLSSIVMTADDTELRINGFEFINSEFPKGGEATIKGAIDGLLEIINCKFSIESEEDRSGGYAVFASSGTDEITIKGCSIDNYRYGFYSHRAGADFDITNNTFTNLTIGIGIDVKAASGAYNVPASGEIGDNTFVDVNTRAEFFFNGDIYNGNLVFPDFQA